MLAGRVAGSGLPLLSTTHEDILTPGKKNGLVIGTDQLLVLVDTVLGQ